MHALARACSGTYWSATVSALLCGKLVSTYGDLRHHDKLLRSLLSGEKTACFAIAEPTAGSDSRHVPHHRAPRRRALGRLRHPGREIPHHQRAHRRRGRGTRPQGATERRHRPGMVPGLRRSAPARRPPLRNSTHGTAGHALGRPRPLRRTRRPGRRRTRPVRRTRQGNDLGMAPRLGRRPRHRRIRTDRLGPARPRTRLVRPPPGTHGRRPGPTGRVPRTDRHAAGYSPAAPPTSARRADPPST